MCINKERQMKTIKSTVASLIKAFESVGAFITLDCFDKHNQYLTIYGEVPYNDGEVQDSVKIVVTNNDLQPSRPCSYMLKPGIANQVSYSTTDWWRIAEKVSGRLGYPIPRSVKIARSLHEKGR